MTNKTQIFNLLNWTVFLIGTVLTYLTLMGKTRFGHGLGDVFYHISLPLLVLINFVIITVLKKHNKWIVLLVFSLLYAYFIYKMTLGRGPEYSWNGEILTG